MAISDENGGIGATMLVGPTGYPMNGGFGSFGNGGDWWGILLLIALLGGGFGGLGGGFGGFGGYDFPWLLNGQQNINNNVSDGFRDAQLQDSVTSVRDGISDLATQLCAGFAGTTASVTNGFAQAEIAANARQMADMQQMFGIQSALQQCCCDNRAATADLKYTVATEACADRAVVSDALRDVIAANTASTQRILDQLCADKIEQKNDVIAQLRSELMYARGQASQDVQTAAIQAGQRALANEVEQYVLPTPRPAYIVQNPNCCVNNGCGVAAF